MEDQPNIISSSPLDDPFTTGSMASQEAGEEAPRALSELINSATRPLHTTLNKLVMHRMSLSIPPKVDNPSNYVLGLLHLTLIYENFESLWKDIMASPLPSPNDESSDSEEHFCEICQPDSVPAADGPDSISRGAKLCTRVHALVCYVHTPELERVQAIKDDIKQLTGWSDALLETKLKSTAASPVLASFLEHTRVAINERPHVLLAYAWVLYMALFSGGRYIRGVFVRVDPSFWISATDGQFPPSPPSSSGGEGDGKGYFKTEGAGGGKIGATEMQGPTLPLRLFTFDAPNSGEDIKAEFKRRLAKSSDSLLKSPERDDVVQEACEVFKFMIKIVGELDNICDTPKEVRISAPAETSSDNSNDEEDEGPGLVGRFKRLLGLRSRDSVVVTRERRAWRTMGDRVQGSADGKEEQTCNDSVTAQHGSSSSSGQESRCPTGGPSGSAASGKSDHVWFDVNYTKK